jgi:hypothetical protein
MDPEHCCIVNDLAPTFEVGNVLNLGTTFVNRAVSRFVRFLASMNFV